jgi:hypothetical protein
MGRRSVHAWPSRGQWQTEREYTRRAIRAPETGDRPNEIASVHLPSKTRNLFGDFQAPSRVRAVESSGVMERAMGIEPSRDSRYVAEIIGYFLPTAVQIRP